MDELERELRAELSRRADGPEPSDDLVERTVGRTMQIRRRRNTVAAFAVAAAVLVVTFAVAAMAGADTHRAHFQVTGPPDSEIAETTSTTAPVATSTTPPAIQPLPGPLTPTTAA